MQCRLIWVYSNIFKHIQAYPDIISHIQAKSGLLQAYSEPCVTLAYSVLCYIQNPDIFKSRGIFTILIYPKLWYFHNQRHIQDRELFRALRYSELEVYSESCQALTMERFGEPIIIYASYNIFLSVSFSCLLVHEVQ